MWLRDVAVDVEVPCGCRELDLQSLVLLLEPQLAPQTGVVSQRKGLVEHLVVRGETSHGRRQLTSSSSSEGAGKRSKKSGWM